MAYLKYLLLKSPARSLDTMIEKFITSISTSKILFFLAWNCVSFAHWHGYFDWLENNYSSGSGAGGQVAKDALGNDVIASEWLKTHGPGDRTLTQGLKVLIHLTNGLQTCSIWFHLPISIYTKSSSLICNTSSSIMGLWYISMLC